MASIINLFQPSVDINHEIDIMVRTIVKRLNDSGQMVNFENVEHQLKSDAHCSWIYTKTLRQNRPKLKTKIEFKINQVLYESNYRTYEPISHRTRSAYETSTFNRFDGLNEIVCIENELVNQQNAIKQSLLEDETRIAIEKSKLDEERRIHDNRVVQKGILELKVLSLVDPDDANFKEVNSALEKYHDETDNKPLLDKSERDYSTFIGKSNIIVEICNVFKDDVKKISEMIRIFSTHIINIASRCMEKDNLVVYSYHNRHKLMHDFTVFYNRVVNEKLVPIHIKGDGNCLWNSISAALFGDYSMMSSLRLLTAFTMIMDNDLENYIKEQRFQTLDYDQLIISALELQVWGDEMHIMALSLALERPIYSYGSLDHFGYGYVDYEAFKMQYEFDDQINHYKYIADPTHEDRNPILLYYNGTNHYSAVLPTGPEVKPLVPKTQLLRSIKKILDNSLQESSLSRENSTKNDENDNQKRQLGYEKNVDHEIDSNYNQGIGVSKVEICTSSKIRSWCDNCGKLEGENDRLKNEIEHLNSVIQRMKIKNETYLTRGHDNHMIEDSAVMRERHPTDPVPDRRHFQSDYNFTKL